MHIAQSAQVPIPETWFPSEVPGGLESILPQIARWPVLVKPSVGVGARGIVLCHTTAELRKQYSDITAAHGVSFVQDFVPPGGMQYKVDVLCDQQQKVIAGIVYGKTRMYPPDGGSSVLNFSAHRPDILEFAVRMLRELRWTGFCDFDFVLDPRDNVPKLMEINPRPPESFHMGPSVGMNFPLLMYRLAIGEPVDPVLSYPANRFLRFMAGDLMWFLRANNHQRFSTWPNWFHFFGRDTAYQLFRATDWGPALGTCSRPLSGSSTGKRVVNDCVCARAPFRRRLQTIAVIQPRPTTQKMRQNSINRSPASGIASTANPRVQISMPSVTRSAVIAGDRPNANSYD